MGTCSNPELPTDPARFSKEDSNALKETLQQCIPFIKFYNLTSKEFMEKVLPYKKILPKELYKDLLNTFLSLLDPGSKPNDKSKPRITQGTEVVALESSHNKGFYISHQDYLGLM